MLREGLRVQFGSDAPVECINPLLSFHAAVNRQSLKGDPEGGWFPAERLTLEETIHAFTAVPAWSRGRSGNSGFSRPDDRRRHRVRRDLFALAPEKLASVQVEMTMVGGEVAYRRG